MSNMSELKRALKTIHDECASHSDDCHGCPFAFVDDNEIRIDCAIGYPWRPPCNWNAETMICGDAWQLEHDPYTNHHNRRNPMKGIKTKSLPTKEIYGKTR